MMDLFLILGFFISFIPGFYYAYKKNLFVVFGKKYNTFPAQMLVTVPFFSVLCVFLSLIIILPLLLLGGFIADF